MPVNVSMPDLIRIAAIYGHGDLRVFQTGNGTYWVCTCACGYRSTRRRNSEQAQQAAGHHVLVAAREAMKNGYTVAQLEQRHA